MQYLLGGLSLPKPEGFQRENIYIKKGVVSIDGKTGFDFTGMKEKFIIGWKHMKMSDFNSLLAKVQLDVPLDFSIDDGNLQIATTSVIPVVKVAEYETLGSDYLTRIEMELTEVT